MPGDFGSPGQYMWIPAYPDLRALRSFGVVIHATPKEGLMFPIVRTTALAAITAAAVIGAGTASARPVAETRVQASSASTFRCQHVLPVKTANHRPFVTKYGAACLEA